MLLVDLYSFLTHWHFVSLRNSFLVSNKKTLTTQKLIMWSELKYVWATILTALFVSNKKGKHCLCLTTKWMADLLPTCQTRQSTFIYQVFSSVIVKKVTNGHNRTLLVCYTASMHLLLYKQITLPFMVFLETRIKFLKLIKHPWVRNDYIPNEQCFILLLETNNVSLRWKEGTALLESSWCCWKQWVL